MPVGVPERGFREERAAIQTVLAAVVGPGHRPVGEYPDAGELVGGHSPYRTGRVLHESDDGGGLDNLTSRPGAVAQLEAAGLGEPEPALRVLQRLGGEDICVGIGRQPERVVRGIVAEASVVAGDDELSAAQSQYVPDYHISLKLRRLVAQQMYLSAPGVEAARSPVDGYPVAAFAVFGQAAHAVEIGGRELVRHVDSELLGIGVVADPPAVYAV